jgi:hypothetical protein
MAKTRRAAKKSGSRKSRKGGNAWTRKVTELYRTMKRQNKATKFSDALKKASALKKAGKL